MIRSLVLAAAVLALAACSTATLNSQNPTATEQLLAAHAAERAAAALNLRLPPTDKVYLRILSGSKLPYADQVVGAVARHLSARNPLVDTPAEADVEVILSVTAAGIDDTAKVVGFPGMTIPSVKGMTTSYGSVSIPEISLWSRYTRTGVVELHAVAIDARTRRLIAAAGPVGAEVELVRGSILTAISTGETREAAAK